MFSAQSSSPRYTFKKASLQADNTCNRLQHVWCMLPIHGLSAHKLNTLTTDTINSCLDTIVSLCFSMKAQVRKKKKLSAKIPAKPIIDNGQKKALGGS